MLFCISLDITILTLVVMMICLSLQQVNKSSLRYFTVGKVRVARTLGQLSGRRIICYSKLFDIRKFTERINF
jgi:hypothetical protein